MHQVEMRVPPSSQILSENIPILWLTIYVAKKPHESFIVVPYMVAAVLEYWYEVEVFGAHLAIERLDVVQQFKVEVITRAQSELCYGHSIPPQTQQHPNELIICRIIRVPTKDECQRMSPRSIQLVSLRNRAAR